MSDLLKKHCQACEGGVPALTPDAIKTLINQTPQWQLNESTTQIQRRFTFKNFYQTMAFVNALAWLAHQENHHPDLEISYNSCLVKYSTHAVQGLSENDFICAAKVDTLV